MDWSCSIRFIRSILSMKYIKEITDWSDSKVAVPNHTYIVNDAGHLLGYIKTKTKEEIRFCLLYTSPSPRDLSTSRMPSSA